MPVENNSCVKNEEISDETNTFNQNKREQPYSFIGDFYYWGSDLLKLAGPVASICTGDPNLLKLTALGVLIDFGQGGFEYLDKSSFLGNRISHPTENLKYRNLPGPKQYHNIFNSPINTSQKLGKYVKGKWQKYRG